MNVKLRKRRKNMKGPVHIKLIEIASDEMNLTRQVNTDEIKMLMNDYGLTNSEAVIFAFLLKYSMERTHLELEKFDNQIVRKGDENYIRIYRDLKSMQKKGVIALNAEGRRRRGDDLFNPAISIDEAVFSRLVLGEDMFADTDFSCPYSILETADEVIDSRLAEKISGEQFEKRIDMLMSKADHSLELVKVLKKYEIIEKALIFRACLNEIKGDSDDTINGFISNFVSSLSESGRIMKKIYEKRMKCFNDKVLELKDGRGIFGLMGNPVFIITEKYFEKMFDTKTKIKIKEFTPRYTELVKHKDMKKELFFEPGLKKEIDTIASALEAKRFKEVSKKLKSNGFPQGIVSILYGYPGTGKTASVHEIARVTGRNILQVDISNIKDMYVGESEKRLKDVFKEYKKAKNIFKKAPILLFNEADAIIGKRINVSDSVDQMYNNMQNIILEELEKFEGIFFATTNMINNIDDAFDRRFLFKVEFGKPSPEIRKRIWSSKMKDIPEEWTDILSVYELTGGQIDNIVRKYMIDSVLKDVKGIDGLKKFCYAETAFKKEGTRIIGFGR